MFRWVIYVSILTCLIGCVVPISSGCADSQKYQNPEGAKAPSNSKCSTTDAAIYLLAATLKTLDGDEETEVKRRVIVKCSDMIGRAKKACDQQEREEYDPLDEF
jgi:hypothetical protein